MSDRDQPLEIRWRIGVAHMDQPLHHVSSMTRNVTTVLALVLALLLGAPARADGPFDMRQAAQLRTAHALKTAGVAVTLAGVGVEVLTIVLWAKDVSMIHCGLNNPCAGRPDELPPPELDRSAIATTIIAPLLLGIGIP